MLTGLFRDFYRVDRALRRYHHNTPLRPEIQRKILFGIGNHVLPYCNQSRIDLIFDPIRHALQLFQASSWAVCFESQSRRDIVNTRVGPAREREYI